MLGHLAKGDFALITAASSSVGIAAIEIAKAEGATSIAVTRTAAKKAALLKLGADHVIVTDEEDLVARVNQITAGKDARIIFDPIGGKIVEALAAAAAKNGIILEYGALAPEPTPYPLFTALSKFLTIRAYTLFELAADPEHFVKARKYTYDHIAAGNFKPLIDKTFPFSEIGCHRYMSRTHKSAKSCHRLTRQA
jgi:NADPH:quinone reductase-like Zn-dependent oxidoreductase